VYLLVFHAYINEIHGSRSKTPSKNLVHIIIIIIIIIQSVSLFWQEPDPSQATAMTLARYISRQVLRGSLTLLSPAFRRSYFRRQMPPRPINASAPSSER
jgi:hypothetical protein